MAADKSKRKMTNEEAIEILRKIPVGILDLSNEDKWDLTEAIEIAIAALQPSGEPLTLEKLRQKWVGATSIITL